MGSTGGQRLADEASYQSIKLADQDFSDQAGAMLTFYRSALSKVSLARTRLPRLDLNEVVLEACDLANAVWDKARLSKVRLEGCRITGLWNFSVRTMREARTISRPISMRNTTAGRSS